MDIVRVLDEVLRLVPDVRIGIAVRLSPVGLYVGFGTRLYAAELFLLRRSIVVVRMDVGGVMHQVGRNMKQVPILACSSYGGKVRLVLDERIRCAICLIPVGLHVDLGTRRNAVQLCLVIGTHSAVCTRCSQRYVDHVARTRRKCRSVDTYSLDGRAGRADCRFQVILRYSAVNRVSIPVEYGYVILDRIGILVSLSGKMLMDTARLHRICTVLGRLGIERTFHGGYYARGFAYRYDVLPFPAERTGIQFPNGGSHCRAGNGVNLVSPVIRAGYGSMGIHQGLPIIPQYDDIVGSTVYHVVGLPVKGSLGSRAYRLVQVSGIVHVA